METGNVDFIEREGRIDRLIKGKMSVAFLGQRMNNIRLEQRKLF